MPINTIRGRYSRGTCATLAVVTLTLLTTVACGIFSEEPPPAPTATPRSLTSAAIVPTLSPALEVPEAISKDADFYRAVWTGDASSVRQLVADGADVNAIDQDGNPFLYEAVWRNHAEVARVLIDGGAEVNARTWTAIRCCTKRFGGATLRL